MSRYKIIFIHGYTASSQENWYPSIARELEKLGVDFSIPDLPGEMSPHASEWLEKMHDEISSTDKPLILVGHSLGTRAILLYLEKYHPKVEKVFLIASFANKTENANRHDDGRSYDDFFEHAIDIPRVKALVKDFYVIHSKDDSSIEYQQALEIAKDLDAQLITVEDRDHLSEAENADFILSTLLKELSN